MADELEKLEFREVIEEFIKKMGFQVESSALQTDGSVDFKAVTTNPMGGRIISLIRASTNQELVREEDVLDTNRRMNEIGAVRAAYITTSGFSDAAVEAAKDKPISLINKYQLIESIEKRGLLSDHGLMTALDRFGMGEKHFQGVEQSFVPSKTSDETKAYFLTRQKKDELSRISLRYAPVSIIKILTYKEVYTEEQTLSSLEKKDYLFINLNNLDLYYLIKKRRWNSTQLILMRSPIIKKVYELPEESKEQLLHLIEHGDMPLDDFDSKDVSILKNKKFIEVYEGKRFKGTLNDVLTWINQELTETVRIITTEIVSGLTNFGEGSSAPPAKVEDPKKKVFADLDLPHKNGGVYDLWKYIETNPGLKSEGEIDPLKYSSNDIALLVSRIYKAKYENEGIIFMPYYRAKYVKKGVTSKYETLVSPKFKSAEEGKKEKKPVEKSKIRRKALAGDYRLIR